MPTTCTDHQPDLIDTRTGDTFVQRIPFGLVYPVVCADGTTPPSQRGRTWKDLADAGRDLRAQVTAASGAAGGER